MSCGCTQSARKVWMLSFLLIASQVPGLLSVPAAMYTRRSAHVAVPQPAAKCSFAGGCGWSAHHQGTCSHLGVRRRRSQAWESRVHWCGKVRMNVGDEGESRRAGGGPRPKKRPLGLLSTGVNDAILEMCVENKGRPLARALTDFVEYTIEALASGYSAEALLLELQLLDSTTRIPGRTLTGVEKRYRTQWVVAMHAVMQHLEYVDQQEPKSAEEFHIKSQVDVVLRGRQTNDEQTFVKFDKALATGGVAGGVATERIVISPQMVPISQLTLLAIRALQKLEDAAAS